MTLARMIATDEDALICDMAETYQILDYRALPVKLLAALVFGLRESSRSKMALAGTAATQTEILLAAIADRLGHIAWMLSADGQKGRNHPVQLIDILLGKQPGEETIQGTVKTFDSPEEFEAALKAAKGGG